MTTPTPLARAAARVLVLLALLLPAVFRSAGPAGAVPRAQADAAAEWVEVRYVHAGRTYVFYHPKNAPFTNDGGNQRIDLYKEPRVSPQTRAESHLFRTAPNRPWKLHLITETGPRADIIAAASAFTTSAYRPSAPAPSAQPAVPAGVDAAVWAEVQQKYGQGLSPEDQALLGRVLTQFDAANAGKKAAARAWLDADPRARAAQLLTVAKSPAGVPGAVGQLLAWTSGSAGGGAPDPGGPADPAAPRRPGDAPEVGPGTAVGSSSDPVSSLNDQFKPAEHGQDVANRLFEFTWKDRAGKSFIDPDTRAVRAKETALKAELLLVVKNADRRVAVMNLYYGLGTGPNAPAWVRDNPALKKIMVDERGRLANFEDLLVQCLDRWQGGAPGTKPTYCNNEPDRGQTRTPYKGEPTWVAGFILDAGAEAGKLLYAISRSSNGIASSVGGAPNSGPQVPGGPGQRPPSLPNPASGDFGVEQLFGKWGDRNVFSLDGRTLAIVLRTVQTFDGNPPKAVMRQQLGLYDISSEANIYGKRFEFDKPGEQTFALTPGGKNYKISLTAKGSDLEISVTRPDGTPPPVISDGSKTLPTLNMLFQTRAQQALDSGNRVLIGGKAYRVTGESTSTGNLIFWDEDQLERNRGTISGGFAGFAARYWTPTMMASVNKVVDGKPTNVSDAVPLGVQVNGKWQGLRWDGNIWVPAEGDAYKPVATPTAPAPGTPGVPGSTTPVTGTPTGQPGGADRPVPAEGMTLGNGVRYVPDGARAAALNAGLAGVAKERNRFLEANGPAPLGQGILVVQNNNATTIGFPPYLGVDAQGAGSGSISESIVNGRYLVTRTDAGNAYVDMEIAEFLGGAIPKGSVGTYNPRGAGNAINQVTERGVLGIILKQAGYPDDKVAVVMQNLARALADNPNATWSVSGPVYGPSCYLGAVLNNTRSIRVYPAYDPSGARDNAAGRIPGAGQGVWYEKLDGDHGVSLFNGFQDTFSFEGNRNGTRVDPKPGDAALYMVVDGSTTSWYLHVTVKEGDKPLTARYPFLVFEKVTSGEAHRINMPSGLGIGGLTFAGAIRDPQQIVFKPKAFGGTLATKGYVAAYDTPQSTENECVGVVAWWGGLTAEQACSACGAVWRPEGCRKARP